MVAIGIRYYNCRNAAVGIYIWPQLRSASDNSSVIWDGKNSSGYGIPINSAKTVDLKDTYIDPSVKFVLSENTLFGLDMWDTSQDFFYDPASTTTAYATRWGGVDNGSLTYGGCKTNAVQELDEQPVYFPLAEQFEAYAAAVAHEAIRDLLQASIQGQSNSQFPWKGFAKWLSGTSPTFVVSGSLAITTYLINRSYTLQSTTITNPDGSKTVIFLLKPPSTADSPNAVPPKVVNDWNAAVASAAKFKAINGGIGANV